MALQFLGLVSMLIISVALIPVHVIGTIGGGSLYTIMLPFTFNQMIGASAKSSVL